MSFYLYQALHQGDPLIVNNDRTFTAKSISEKLQNFQMIVWLSRTTEHRCLLFESRPAAQQGGCSWHTKSSGVKAAPTTGGGTLCPERRCHGLIHVLLSVAQTAASQQRRFRTAAFKKHCRPEHKGIQTPYGTALRYFIVNSSSSKRDKSLTPSSKLTLSNKKNT